MIEWTFKELLAKGNSKEEIMAKCPQEKYESLNIWTMISLTRISLVLLYRSINYYGRRTTEVFLHLVQKHQHTRKVTLRTGKPSFPLLPEPSAQRMV